MRGEASTVGRQPAGRIGLRSTCRIRQAGASLVERTETIEISGLPRGTRRALEEIGHDDGKTAEEYVRTLIEVEVLARRPFSEILAPIRQSFQASGISEDELDAVVERAREKLLQQNQAKK
jgi:hypothetical protein